MTRILAWAAVLALLAAGAASAAPSPVVIEPDWLSPPTAESLAESYPKIAAALDIEGLSIISCGVRKTGRLAACTVADEWPRGLGFGAAALQMSTQFKMRPQTVDGVPTDGGEVRIPLRFKLPADPSAPPVTRQGPPAPITLARRLMSTQEGFQGFADPIETMLRELESSPAPGVDDDTRMGAVAALRAALPPRLDGVRELIATAVSQTFTAEELAPFVAFQESKTGAVLASAAPLNIDSDNLSKQMQDAFLDELRVAFCEQQACVPSAEDLQRFQGVQPGVAVDRPVWSQVPSPGMLRARAPFIAQFMGVTGVVRLTCSVTAEAGLTACAPSQESPGGWGFGRAALALVSDYRLETVGPAARSVGLTVAVRITFPAALPAVERANDAAPENPLARQLIAQTAPAALDPVQIASLKDSVAKSVSAHTEPMTRDAIVAAAPLAADRAYRMALKRVSQQISAALSDDQIRAMIALAATPSWRTIQSRLPELGARAQSMLSPTMAAWASDARTVFCATHDCTPPPPPQSTGASAPSSTRKP